MTNAEDNKEKLRRYLVQARAGDVEALRALVNAHRDAIDAGVRRGLTTREVSFDSVRYLVFQRIFNKFHKFEGEIGQLGAWMRKVAWNLAIDQTREQLRHLKQTAKNVPLDETLIEERGLDPYKQALMRMAIDQTLETMRADQENKEEAEDRLGVETKGPSPYYLIMAFINEVDPQKIAEEFHYAVSTIREKILKARREFMRIFLQHYPKADI